MADDYDTEVHTAGAGASTTYPEQCSKLRKGGYVMIKDRPCKVVDMSTSKTGKHGHAKVHYVGLDIFTGKKYEDICPSTHSVNVPNVSRSEVNVVDVSDDGFLEIMDDVGDCSQIKCPDKYTVDEVKGMLKDAEAKEDCAINAVVWKAVGQEEVLELKQVKNK